MFGNNYRVEFKVTYFYDAQRLVFVREFKLPFVPYIGLNLVYKNDYYIGDENLYNINLYNDSDYVTNISYNTISEMFHVDIIHNIGRFYNTDRLDELVNKKFNRISWKRLDDTDINKMKELINTDR